MACWYEKVILKGDLYYYTDSKSDGMVNEYYWWYDNQCVEDLQDSLFHLDGFITNIYLDSRVGLFSKHSKLEFTPDEILNINELPTPKWLNKENWDDDDFYYSVGKFTSLFEKNDGWKTAEEQAFLNLVSSVISDIKSVSYTYSMDKVNDSLIDEYEEVIKNSFYCEVKNATVIERWFHNKDSLFYVLVKVAKENFFYPDINKSKGRDE